MRKSPWLALVCGAGLLTGCGESTPVDRAANNAEDAALERARVIEDAATLKAQDVREREEAQALSAGDDSSRKAAQMDQATGNAGATTGQER